MMWKTCAALAALSAVFCAAAALKFPNNRVLRTAVFPVSVQIFRDIPYGAHPENRLDIMRPRLPARAVRPAVVVFHGGAWQNGNRTEMLERVV
jgi:acetyl esterase/lipase